MRRLITSLAALLVGLPPLPVCAQTLPQIINSAPVLPAPTQAGDKVPVIRGSTTYQVPASTSIGGNVLGPASSVINDLACYAGTTGKVLSDCGVPAVFTTIVNTTTILKATPATGTGLVQRLGYNATGDGGDALYRLTTGACSLNGGAGDGGYQVAITGDGGHCWTMIPSYPQRAERWGIFSPATPVTFYVDNAAGNDNGGANSCLRSGSTTPTGTPCKTLGQAVKQYYSFFWYGASETVQLLAGQTFNETVAVNSPLVPALGLTGTIMAPQLYLSGGGATTVIAGDGVACGSLIATYGGAMIGVTNLKVTGVAAGCQSSLFAQEGGVINVYGGVTFGAASQQDMHAEEAGSQIEIWNSYTKNGNAVQHWGASQGGQIVYNPNAITVTLSGTPAFSGGFGLAQHQGLVLLANDTTFSGSATGGSFVVESGGAIVSNNSSLTALPGNAVGSVYPGGIIFPANKLITTPVSVTSSTGVGASGTVTTNTDSLENIQLTVTPGGAGIAATGNITLNLGAKLQYLGGNSIACSGSLSNGTGTWAQGASPASLTVNPSLSATTPAISLIWGNGGTNLSSGQTYIIGLTCPNR